MSKVIYLVRHSVRFDYSNVIDYKTDQSYMLKSEKIILSPKGEKRAEALATLNELDNLDAVYASNCVRTLGTAKYLMSKQRLNCFLDERLDERRVGIPNSSKFTDWFSRQFKDPDYKTEGGESQRDVVKRVNEVIDDIIENKKDKRIAIFSHGYAILFFLLQYCKLVSVDEERNIHMKYHNKNIMKGKINAPEVFK